MVVFSHGGLILVVGWVLETQPIDPHPYKWVLVVGHKSVVVVLTQPPFVVTAVFLHGVIMVRVDWALETQPPDPHLFKWVRVVGRKWVLVVTQQP
jgi:hypothetical protein